MLTELQRIWTFIDQKPGGCWIWTGSVNSWGYGACRIGGRRMQAVHRYMYQQFVGQLEQRVFCLHKCDTPRCVNPDHLFIGDATANSADKVAKGRHAKGEMSRRNKLTEVQVREILANPPKLGTRGKLGSGNVKEYADRYGVKIGAICSILRGDSWSYLRITSTAAK